MAQISGVCGSAPTLPAPTPTYDATADNVIALYSNAYTTVPVDIFQTSWSVADPLLDTVIDGNNALKYSNVSFVGIETIANQIDLAGSGATTFRFDYYSDNGTSLGVKLVDLGADGMFQGGDDVEHRVQFDNLPQDEWVILEIPISDFTGLTTSSNIAQIIFDGQPNLDLDFYVDNILFHSGTPASQKQDLPLSFDNPSVDYQLSPFQLVSAQVVTDPTDADNNVLALTKGPTSQPWAGVVFIGFGQQFGFARPIVFTNDVSEISMRVWSPQAGTPYRLKAEVGGNTQPFVEVDRMTTVNGGWETLVFDFSDPIGGTFVPGQEYNQLVAFPNWLVTETMDVTYYLDDIVYVEPCDTSSGGGNTGLVLPATFDDANIDYDLNDFGDLMSAIVVDPSDPGNMVVQSTKPVTAPLWGGTTLGKLAQPLAFDVNNNKLSVRVWSPDANTVVRLKAEDSNDATKSVETEATTGAAMEWDTLVFDFSMEAAGTAAIDYTTDFDLVSIFFNFGTDGATAGEKTYFWDDVTFGDATAGSGMLQQVSFPVTFEDTATVDYSLVDFGGAVSQIIEDPVMAGNTVVETVKTAGSATFAGTVVGNTEGLAGGIPFTSSAETISVRVWSPTAGTPVRLKVENVADPSIAVETQEVTTTAMQWETITFDFTQPAAGTSGVLDLNADYEKIIIFFNFGDMPAADETYYWDDIVFTGMPGNGGSGPVPMTPAPTPTRDAANVLSIYSDAYTDVNVDTYRTSWSQAAFNEIMIDGNATIEYTNLGFVGIETITDPIDLVAANMTHVHLDYWTPNMDTLLFKIVDFGNDGFDNGTDTEDEIAIVVSDSGEWVSLDISLDSFPGLMGRDDINQYIFSSRPFGTGTVFMDNIYFYNTTISTNRPETGVLRSYPNPATEMFTIESPELMQSIEVVDGAGRMVRSFTTNTERFVLPTADLAPGLYIVRARSGDRVLVAKMLKR